MSLIEDDYDFEFKVFNGDTHRKWVDILINETGFIYDFHYSELREKAQRSGLYFLLNKENQIVYIGASHNIFVRVQSHGYKKKWEYAKLYLTKKNPFHIEYKYISKYKPIYNKNGYTKRQENQRIQRMESQL